MLTNLPRRSNQNGAPKVRAQMVISQPRTLSGQLPEVRCASPQPIGSGVAEVVDALPAVTADSVPSFDRTSRAPPVSAWPAATTAARSVGLFHRILVAEIVSTLKATVSA